MTAEIFGSSNVRELHIEYEIFRLPALLRYAPASAQNDDKYKYDEPNSRSDGNVNNENVDPLLAFGIFQRGNNGFI